MMQQKNREKNLCSFSYWISRLAAFKMRGQNSPLCSLYNCSRKKVLYCYVLLQCICYTILHSTSKRKKKYGSVALSEPLAKK